MPLALQLSLAQAPSQLSLALFLLQECCYVTVVVQVVVVVPGQMWAVELEGGLYQALQWYIQLPSSVQLLPAALACPDSASSSSQLYVLPEMPVTRLTTHDLDHKE